MALVIYEADRDPAGAMAVFRTVALMRPSLQGDADMGQFWVSRRTEQAHALTTCGAGPCTIIVIRDGDGGGGLGHYGGTANPDALLSGLTAMLQKLGSQNITDVLFAAGDIEDEDQANFDQGILAGAARLCPTATLARVRRLANSDVAASAVFLPRDGQVALFGNAMRDRFWGTGGEDGLVSDWYPEYR